MKLFRGWQLAAAPEPVVGRRSAAARPDGGPVVVLVDELGADDDALAWAAAEAAARGSELRIVHAFRWPRALDPLGSLAVDPLAREAAETTVAEAASRAGEIASSLRITTRLFPGRRTAALIAEAHDSDHALVVIGRGRLERSIIRRLVRRTTASVAVVGLSSEDATGPSETRVVVGIGDDGVPPTTLGFAFRAARRRSTGLTIVLAPTTPGDAVDAVLVWRMAYPDVDVRWSLQPASIGTTLLAESSGAALTVLGPTRGSASYEVLRLADGPVVMV